MTTWFISRHPGAEYWMKSQEIYYDHHLTHLSDQIIAQGDIVIGTLPVNLAAEICAKGAYYWNLSLTLPESARGQELSKDELNLYQAKIEAFSINKNHQAPKLQADPIEMESIAPVAPTPSKDELYQWNQEIFKAYVFNQEFPEQGEEKAERLMMDYRQRLGENSALLLDLDKTRRQAKHAVQLTSALLKKIHEGESESDIKEWLVRQQDSQARRISKHLSIVFEKQTDYRANKKALVKENRDYQINLEETPLVNGLHPQSLRSLKPSAEWDIYIDETGSDFSAQASERLESDNQLGRVIALALPAGHTLAPLKKPLHAVDLPNEEIESLLKMLTQQPIGLLGATLKRDLHSYNWISAVHQLTRWLLLLLPLDKQPTQVRVHIENRGEYIADNQLLALQDTLENELKRLLPVRFEHLRLRLNIMDKNHPYNGYVDVIANCWGSKKNNTKRQLLARTNWLGHCLLQSTTLERAEDIYRQVFFSESVEPVNWFTLCEASLGEPKQSMLHDMLDSLGKRSKEDPTLWRAYLDEVSTRLSNKNFSPASLQVALGWLERYQNQDYILPSYLQLELLSQKLASGNHQGETHLALVEKILPLINELTDEYPEAASQAVLRIAVRGTHLYDFASPIPLVQFWLDYPIAVPGLLNHAKLHSTLGQLKAFEGKHEQALQSFELALNYFSRLSDQKQLLRESAQTRIYQAVVMQDARHEEAVTHTLTLVKEIARRQNPQQAIEHMARSRDPIRRFAHHVLLRLLVTYPELSEFRHAYLAVQDEWQSENDHPWHLINAYRAWLLHDENHIQAAHDFMEMAIKGCMTADKPMLTWMGYCLHALAKSFAMSITLPSHTPLPEYIAFPVAQLTLLEKATNNTERVQHLQHLLPFNFH